MNGSAIVKSAKHFLKKKSPYILMGCGIAGFISTIGSTIRATPKAMELIEERKKSENVEKLTPVQTVQTVWKCYIPTAILGLSSMACFVGSNSIYAKRSAAIATALTLSETTLREYRDKVVETIGSSKEKTIRDAVAKEKIESQPVSESKVIVTEHGETLCYDSLSGQYFKSDIERIRRIVNEVNREMIGQGYVMLNDFYYELGLNETKLGYQLGWNVDRGLIEVKFSSQLASDGRPCLVIDFDPMPIPNF